MVNRLAVLANRYTVTLRRLRVRVLVIDANGWGVTLEITVYPRFMSRLGSGFVGGRKPCTRGAELLNAKETGPSDYSLLRQRVVAPLALDAGGSVGVSVCSQALIFRCARAE